MAQGRVRSGHQARLHKLVDRTGGLYEAVQAARRLAHLTPGDGHEVIVLPKEPPGLLARALKLFVPEARGDGQGRLGGNARAVLLKRLLSPLAAIPPSL